MLFKDITIIDEKYDVYEGMYVGIKDQVIHYIGNELPEGEYGREYGGRGRLLMSGFFNAHAHSPMTLLRGYGENMSLQDWLNQRIFPFEAELTGEAVYYATLLAIAESLRFGIVSSTDMYYFCEDMALAVLESGVKNNMGRAITCFSDQALYDLKSFHEARSFYENYNGAAEGRLLVDMSLHAEYTSTPKVAKELADYTAEIGARMHIHVSETKKEHQQCKERHGGKTPVEYFHELGYFKTGTTLAHCVWLEERDMDILADKDVFVASCPISNLKLASGVCNVPGLMEKGIEVAIGTDSVASNNSLNFIEEMKFFSTVHKGRYGDPTLITPKDAIKAATRIGALSQGRKDTGALKVGMKADLIVLDLEGPHMMPCHDLLNNLVYSASGSDVVMTMVDGKVLYEEGCFNSIDLERVRFETERCRNRILRDLKK
ncbi:MAG: amidohydrolase [Anaerovoracaceae bacterium]|jgi:5-methylthioadenosine/S-adenosylhomocysteine deaminase